MGTLSGTSARILLMKVCEDFVQRKHEVIKCISEGTKHVDLHV